MTLGISMMTYLISRKYANGFLYDFIWPFLKKENDGPEDIKPEWNTRAT